MKRVVVLGAENLQQLSGVTESLHAVADSIDVIAHPLNRISTQLPSTAYGLIVEREAGETAFRALRRLARKPAAYETAVVYWFDASDGFVRHRWNLRNILIARWIARSIIIVRGERWLRPSAGYVTKKVSGWLLNQITSDKTTLLFVALAALLVIVRALLAIPLLLRDVLA